MTKSVDDLVASLPEAIQRHRCWASSLDGRAAAFVAGVKAREASGVTLLRGDIIDMLKREFGVSVSREALIRHLKDRCKC